MIRYEYSKQKRIYKTTWHWNDRWLRHGSSLADSKNKDRFHIGIQEYTFHRWLNSGKLDHLDYPALVKKELGISHVEYWNRPFGGKHTDQKYVGELVKRTRGEGIKNVLILVDEKHELDHASKSERDKSVELHKAWIDCCRSVAMRSG